MQSSVRGGTGERLAEARHFEHSMLPNSSIASEEDRLKKAYARRIADPRYSWFSRGNLWMVQRRERDVLDALRRNGVDGLSNTVVLDLGCGGGPATLAPPIARRRLAPVSWLACSLLEALPFLRTHYVGVLRRAR